MCFRWWWTKWFWNENCDDILDNDADGFNNCDDSDCAFYPSCYESDCSDGTDNDGDTLVDWMTVTVPSCVLKKTALTRQMMITTAIWIVQIPTVLVQLSVPKQIVLMVWTTTMMGILTVQTQSATVTPVVRFFSFDGSYAMNVVLSDSNASTDDCVGTMTVTMTTDGYNHADVVSWDVYQCAVGYNRIVYGWIFHSNIE